MMNLALFEIEVEHVDEDLIRDEFGWVDGHQPGCGKFRHARKTTHRVVANHEEQAKERVLRGYAPLSKGEKAEIIRIVRHNLDAVILEFQP